MITISTRAITAITGGDSGTAIAQSGEAVSAERLFGVSTAWACGRLIAQTIASMPVGMYRNVGDSRQAAPNHALHSLISLQPAARVLARKFWESILLAVVFWGNAFARIVRLNGRVVSLQLLNPSRLSWRCLPNSSEVEFAYIEQNGRRSVIPEADIFHVPGLSADGRFGVSVIRAGAEVFGSAFSAQRSANMTFKQGMMPTVAFTYDRVVGPQQRDEFRTYVEKISGAMRAGKSPLLERGMDVKPIGINPVDAQLLQSRTYSAVEICTWFGVPPSMIGLSDKSSSWASSAENLNLWFLTYTIAPLLGVIEQAITLQLLPVAERGVFFPRWNTSGMLRTNISARKELYASALQNGWMNRDEVRAKEEMDAIPGGDAYTVQTNLGLLSNIGGQDENSTP